MHFTLIYLYTAGSFCIGSCVRRRCECNCFIIMIIYRGKFSVLNNIRGACIFCCYSVISKLVKCDIFINSAAVKGYSEFTLTKIKSIAIAVFANSTVCILCRICGNFNFCYYCLFHKSCLRRNNFLKIIVSCVTICFIKNGIFDIYICRSDC